MLDVLELPEVIEIIKNHYYSCKESFYNSVLNCEIIENYNGIGFFLPRNKKISEREIHNFKNLLDGLQRIFENSSGKKLIYHRTNARNALGILKKGFLLPFLHDFSSFGIPCKGHGHNAFMMYYLVKELERLQRISNKSNEFYQCKTRVKILDKLTRDDIEPKIFFSKDLSTHFTNNETDQVIFAIDPTDIKLEKMLIYREKINNDDIIQYYFNEKDIEIQEYLKELDVEKILEEYFTYHRVSINCIKYIIIQDLCNIKYLIEQNNGKFYSYS
jgi:hypothetical protein